MNEFDKLVRMVRLRISSGVLIPLLLQMLLDGEMYVNELRRKLPIAVHDNDLYHTISKLEEMGIVTTTKNGHLRFCRLTDRGKDLAIKLSDHVKLFLEELSSFF